MNEAAVRKEVIELVSTITSSPYAGRSKAASLQSVCPTGVGQSLEESLEHLRLQVKYLLFDLEATRRENRYLRQMLESRHRRDVDDFKGDDSPGS